LIGGGCRELCNRIVLHASRTVVTRCRKGGADPDRQLRVPPLTTIGQQAPTSIIDRPGNSFSSGRSRGT
jgi:hypothetical protein